MMPQAISAPLERPLAEATTVRYERAPMYPKQEAALFTPARYAVVEAST